MAKQPTWQDMSPTELELRRRAMGLARAVLDYVGPDDDPVATCHEQLRRLSRRLIAWLDRTRPATLGRGAEPPKHRKGATRRR